MKEKEASRKKQHIIFLLGGWDIGGAERVTSVLADGFIRQGFRVTIAAFKFERRDLLKQVSHEIEICELSYPVGSSDNIAKLRAAFMPEEKIFVINNWALPFVSTHFLRKAVKGYDAKIIACLHNTPITNGKIAGAKNKVVRFIWRILSGISMHLVYRSSDAYVLLSKSFAPLFRHMAFLPTARKLYAISNPLTLSVAPAEKENAILYVGRLEETQKRVSRVLAIWRKIQSRLPDWRLDIVGDGPDRVRYEESAKDLKRITFHGFQNPKSYYEDSKLLLLTSDFEGFGLVLVEAMSARCVPVALGSYVSVCDIIDSGLDGMVLPMPYDEDAFADAVCSIAKENVRLKELACNAEQKAKSFTVDAVVKKWTELFARI